MNSFIESKKLYFNTAKCFQIHIGPRKEECCELKVHDKKMKQVCSEKYLGDILSNSGNDENIENRRKIGNQTISDLMTTLQEVGVGGFYIKSGLIYRDAILKPKLLLNSEVWHSLTLQQISILEEIDKKYLRIILNCHEKVALECIYFECGVMALEYDVMKRRLLYLWKLLHLNENELIFRVFKSQEISSNQGDWVRQVENDKKKLGLEITNSEIRNLSKLKFKTLIKSKIESFALHKLNEMKLKHEKSQYLHSTSFKVSEYLVDRRFSKSEAQILFKLRSRTLNLKKNFSSQSQDDLCRTCKLFPETQSHLLQCPGIVPRLKILCVNSLEVSEEMIYGGVEDQLQIAKIYIKIWEIRKTILEEDESVQSVNQIGQCM